MLQYAQIYTYIHTYIHTNKYKHLPICIYTITYKNITKFHVCRSSSSCNEHKYKHTYIQISTNIYKYVYTQLNTNISPNLMCVDRAQAAMTTNINIHTYITNIFKYLPIFMYIQIHTNISSNWMVVEPAQAAMNTNMFIHTYKYLQIFTNMYIHNYIQIYHRI